MTDSGHLPTPDISHLTSTDYLKIYEPAEDSFLLIDALEKDVKFLNQLRPSVCLEVGCGTGLCLTFLAQILQTKALFIATDINPSAVDICQKTAQQNNISIQPILTDLVSCLSDRLEHQVDVLLFNPPYVVTSSSEVGSHGIEASWAGGVEGREVTDRLLPYIDKVLSKTGVFYLVIVKENLPGK
ncbi:methyltransferase N6AMT1 [Patella vulgata]|uniref:methyltransferase N6AMT1 n=1 Tax=Patella vulgata TaxID=6465 RepID=UPI0024A942D0|nr:methyltransferase N6AMT1 [Patella vulgata]